MEYAKGKIGRVIAARFHDGEPVYLGIEEIARREKIESGMVVVVGGVRRGRVVVGPKQADGPIQAMVTQFDDAREIAGVGSIHSVAGEPVLHLHGAIGRGGDVIVGCPRLGLDAFLVLEAFIIETLGLSAGRQLDLASGLYLLSFAKPIHVDLAQNKPLT